MDLGRNFLVLILFLFSFSLYGFGIEAGEIVELKGGVRIIDQKGIARNASLGEKNLAEAIIETGAGSKAVLVLDDGSKLELGEKSRVKLNDPMVYGSNSVLLYLGRLFARVIPIPEAKDSGFIIATITSIAGVRGTNFEVAVGMDGAGLIGVEDGEVVVSSEQGEVLVKKGEQAEISPEGRVSKVKRVPKSDEEWQKWFQEREKFFVEHSEEMVNFLSLRIDKSRNRIKQTDQLLLEKREQLKKEEGKKLGYFQVRNRIRPVIGVYSRMLADLSQADNKLLVVNYIIGNAEQEISGHPELFSKQFKEQMLKAKVKLDEINVSKVHEENKKMIAGHFIVVYQMARKFNLEGELWKNLPAKTKAKVIKKAKTQNLKQ